MKIEIIETITKLIVMPDDKSAEENIDIVREKYQAGEIVLVAGDDGVNCDYEISSI
jgi:hypothetical protein